MTKTKKTINICYRSGLADMIQNYVTSIMDLDTYNCDTLIKEKRDYKLNLKLYYGVTNVNFENNIIEVDYTQESKAIGLYHLIEKYETLKISNISEDPVGVLERFILKAREYNDKKDKNEIICKIYKNGNWFGLSKQPKRSLDTIFIDKNLKEDLYDDITNFINNESDYLKYGIPYKRNYLFEGLPGTGKTSLVFSISSTLNYNLYIINLGPSIDDVGFASAINTIPSKSILLLEDIDSLFVKREASSGNNSAISFSGILNVLDGASRKTGLITFITTNYKNKLDSALIRPGRIDYILSFTVINKDQIYDMFIFFFPNQIDNFDKFYNKIFSLNLTTCILHKFFFENRKSENIVLEIDKLKKILSSISDTDKAISNMYN